MTDMTPISLTNASPVIGPLAVAAPRQAGADAGMFGQTLGAFLDAQDQAGDPPASASADRQRLAGDGQDAPVADADAPDGPDLEGPALPWIILVASPGTIAPAPAAPLDGTSPTPPVATGTTSGAVPDVTVSAPPATLAPTIPLPLTLAETPAIPLPPASVPAPAAAALKPILTAPGPLRIDYPAVSSDTFPSPVAALSQSVAALLSGETKAASDLPTQAAVPAKWTNIESRRVATAAADASDTLPPVAAQVESAITVSTSPQPARQIFAAAISAAFGWRDKATKTASLDAPVVAQALATGTLDSNVVAATGTANDAPLDLTKDSGLQGMIDRIETLRDGADATDTRIRLTPDALGGVEIAVRTSGDQVHVHFTAEREATQALLADAQPRLTELAANRGLRLDASVSTGTSQHGQGGNTNPQPGPPVAPRPVTAPITEATDQPGEQRLA